MISGFFFHENILKPCCELDEQSPVVNAPDVAERGVGREAVSTSLWVAKSSVKAGGGALFRFLVLDGLGARGKGMSQLRMYVGVDLQAGMQIDWMD